MKKIFTFIGAALLVASAAQAQVVSTIYPDEVIDSNYVAPMITVAPIIDGDPTDASWAGAAWKRAFYLSAAMDANGSAFSGKTDLSFEYKIVWDATSYYILMRYIDDVAVYTPMNNGYRLGAVPTEVAAITTSAPAVGEGSETIGCQAFRMDQINFWLTPHTAEIENGTTKCSRADNSVWHTFYPSVGTTATTLPAYAKLWVPKHTPLATAPTTQPHEATVAATFNVAEGAYYIEFKDASWTSLFANTKFYPIIAVEPALSQKDYRTIAPAIGDKFCMGGEVNDADVLTNTRDYVNYIAWKTVGTGATNKQNPNLFYTETMTITLGDANGQTGINNTKANNSLGIYPNITAGNTINLNRVADVQIFSLSGSMMLESKNSSVINISNLKQGVYMVKDSQGNVSKLVRK